MILADTCVVLFEALQSRPLTKAALTALDEADRRGELCVLDITLWEIAQLISVGRLQVAADPHAFIEDCIARRDMRVLPITPAIAAAAARVELHKDPADRLIAAATLVHGASLVTADERLRDAVWLPTIW